MKWFIYVFFAAFLFGQLGSVSLVSGINIYLHDYLLGVVWVYLVYIWFTRKKLVKPHLLLPLLAFVVVGMISLLINILKLGLPQWFLSSLYLGRWIAYAGIYPLVLNTDKLRGYWQGSLFAAGVGMATIGLAQFIFFPSLSQLQYLGWDPHLSRVFGSLFDPNYLGIVLVLTMLLGVELVTSQAKKYPTIYVISLVVVMLGLILTYSRSSYLGFLVGFWFWSVRRGWWKKGMIAGLIFLIAVVLVPKLGGDTLRLDRFTSIVARVGNWQQSWQLVQKSPLFGLGFNTLRFTNPPSVTGEFIPSRAAGGLDSSLFFVWATTGLLGLVTFIWFLGKSWGSRNSGNLLWQSSLVAVLVHSLFLNSLFYPWVMIWLWVILGVSESNQKSHL